MNVLYLDHTSLVSGAQRALLDLLEALPEDVAPTVMCPPGQLADSVMAIGVTVVTFRGTSGSLRLHPWHTFTALWDIVASARAVRRAARATHADVIHANSLRAGLIAGCARPFVRAPVVVHVHDALPPTRSARLVRRILQASTDAAITISDYTTENFAGQRLRDRVHMLQNPLDLGRFDPQSLSKSEARESLGLSRDGEIVGLVAQITPWKGHELAIRALKLLHERRPGARLLIIGEAKFVERSTRYDNVTYLRELHRLVAELGLGEHVEFWGERDDVPTIMRALDVLVAPSWEEPFGRTVIEAMAVQTPVIATTVGGPAEYIQDGIDGILLPPTEPAAWAAALERLLADPQLRSEMGDRASEKVRRLFDRDKYAAKVVDVYEGLLRRQPGARPGPSDRPGSLRVVLVDHQGLLGGGQRSFLELMRVVSAHRELILACPDGPFAAAARALGVSVIAIPESQLTFRIHPWQTPRELVRAMHARRAVQTIIKQVQPDVVHPNSLRAGLLAICAGHGPPVVVHCRDLVPPHPIGRVVQSLILRRSRILIAVSRAVAAQFPQPQPGGCEIVVIDNPVDIDRFDPQRIDGQQARRELGVEETPLLGVLAQITPWKGQTRAVRILERVRRTHPGAQLLLAGSAKFVTPATRFDNVAYERELVALVARLGLEDAVHLLGERDDAERVMAALDVLLVPSSEEPFGRTVIEALAMGIPVVATSIGGPAEVIRPGVDGVVLPPDDLDAWAEAVVTLAARGPSPDSRAYAIERFSSEHHAARVLEIYEGVADFRRELPDSRLSP